MRQNDQYRQHRTSVVVNFNNEISAEGIARKLCENYLHQPSLSAGATLLLPIWRREWKQQSSSTLDDLVTTRKQKFW